MTKMSDTEITKTDSNPPATTDDAEYLAKLQQFIDETSLDIVKKISKDESRAEQVFKEVTALFHNGQNSADG